MPWKSMSIMENRREFVRLALLSDVNAAVTGSAVRSDLSVCVAIDKVGMLGMSTDFAVRTARRSGARLRRGLWRYARRIRSGAVTN